MIASARRFFLAQLVVAAGCTSSERSVEPSGSPVDTLAESMVVGGGVVHGPEYEFGQVSGVLALPDGGVAIADYQNNVVRFFDARGKHRFSAGGSGEGPGEFDGPCCLVLDSIGRLWVRDGGNLRYNGYRIDESAARFISQRRMVHTDLNRIVGVTFDRRGHLVDVGSRTDSGVSRDFRFHLDSSGAVVRELRLPAAPPESIGMKIVRRTTEGMTATLYAYQPFGPAELVAHGPGGEFAHAVSSRYSIDWRRDDGTLLRRLTAETSAGPPLSDAERKRVADRVAQQAKRLGIRNEELGFSVPATKPPLRALFFDLTGRLWVELAVPDGDARRAHVYSRDGTLERTVLWPSDVSLKDGSIRDSTAWGVRLDSLDVPSLVLLRPCSRGAPGGSLPPCR